MIRLILYLFFGLFFTNTVFAQKTIQNKNNQPKIKIDAKVQKDENGNIISYDSTYVKTWSSNGENIPVDSLMKEFNQKFTDLGFNFSNDFFSDDFGLHNIFSNNDTINQQFIFPDISDFEEQMFEDMKKIENLFNSEFNLQFSPMVPSCPKSTKPKKNVKEQIKNHSVKI